MASMRFLFGCGALALAMCLAAPRLRAQYAPAPETYSVTQINSMMGSPVTMKIYRDGSKAVVDMTHASARAGGKTTQLRTLYDFATHQNLSWSLDDPAARCTPGSFSGDWGDPFAMAAQLNGDLEKQHVTQTGTETVNGVATKVFEAALPNGAGKAKVWVEAKYGLVMRFQMSQGNGEPQTIIETKQAIFARPDAALFVPPASCAASAPPVPVPDGAAKIVAETGGPAADFVKADEGPGTKDPCTVLFRVLHMGSMAPVTSAYQVTYEGKFLPVQNGTVRIDNPPDHFELDMRTANGFASALIYRHCMGPQTTLLLLVKNPEKLSDGADWLWVKSGKFAAK